MNLTQIEKEFLNAMRYAGGYDLFCQGCNFKDSCKVSSESDNEYLDIVESACNIKFGKTFSGITASLIKKDLVYVYKAENYGYVVDYNQETIKEVFKEESGGICIDGCRIPYLKID